MKKKFVLIPLLGIFIYVILTSASSGPGTVYGVYGYTAGCGGGSCHGSGSTASTTVNVQLLSAGVPVTSYVSGNAYTIRVTGTQTSGSFSLATFGFQVSAVLAAATSTNAGSLSIIGLSHSVSPSGINVIEHSTPFGATTGSGGAGTTYVVNIPWTATSTSGSVSLRGVINAVNGGGADAGDKWNTGSVTIPELAPVTGTASTCVSGSTTLSNTFSGGTWSTASSNVSVGLTTGVVSGVAVGTAVVTYTGGGNFVTKIVTVDPSPGTIGGSLTICQTQTTNLTNTVSGGTWSSASSNVSVTGTGGVTGINAGTALVTYAIGSCSVTATVVINPLAANTGSLNVCEGATTLLSNTNSGGTWTSSAPAIGSVVSTSGMVTGVTAGTTNISYTLPTGCVSVSTVTVNVQPPAIGGPTTVCLSATITATNTAPGLWSATGGTGSVSVVAATGVITGSSVGTATVSYTATGGCFATETVIVNPLPSPILGGFTPVCAGSAITLTSATGGGTWSSANPSIASITSGGVVTGVATGGGNSLISYTLSTGCRRTFNVSVNPVTPISGALNVCTGLTTALTSGPAGGTWTSSTPAAGTVSTSGVVTGIAAGTTTITYNTGSCTATAVVSVGALAPITGGGSVCVGSTLSLNDATTGGTWSSSATAIGTINTTSGLFTALTTGTTTVSYTTGTGCSISTVITVNAAPGAVSASGGGTFCNSATITASGGSGGTIYFQGTTAGGTSTATPSTSEVITSSGTYYFRVQSALGCWGPEASVAVTINPNPSPITGPGTVCVSSVITLSSLTSGGTWSSSSPGIASINTSTGVVTGIATGTAACTFTVATGCFTTTIVTVNPLPGPITGILTICSSGGTTALSSSPSGGTWTSSNVSVATVGIGTGIVTAIASSGTDIITYTLSTGCKAIAEVTINPLPSSIAGTATVCVGSATTLSSTPAGGAWSSSSPSIGTVDAASGVVTGIAPGTTTISYMLSTGCFATKIVSVNPNPAPFVGSIVLCAGATTTLSTTTFTYSSSNSSVISVDMPAGILTGVSAGNATITVAFITTGCFTTTIATVNPTPSAISGGATSICVGASASLSSAPSGGTWSTGSSVVSVNSSGTVTGLAAGIGAVSYSLSTGCRAITAITVNPIPAAITGTLSVCQGFNTTLGNTTTGGSWSSSNTSVAIVGAGTGVVNGVGLGTAMISYTLSTGCARSVEVTVNAVPASISGTATTCVGTTTTLSTSSTGGTWSTSSGAIATVGASSGVVTGAGVGTATISYSFGTGCFTTYVVTVSAAPSAGTISGSASVCTGFPITLTDAVTGGTWSASNGNATVSSSGVVTGVTAGTVTITYTVNTSCGTVFATKDITVTTSATAGAISGALNTCIAGSTTLSSSVTGGTWLSGNSSVATITSPGGVVSGIAAGTSTITYTVTSGCGTATTTAVLTVNAPPAASGGTPTVCVGGSTTLTNVAGTWESSNTSIAAVGATNGIVSGISAATAIITFTQTSTGCSRNTTITVNPLPSPIGGPLVVCTGTLTTLTNATTGGTWTSSTPIVASIGTGTGVVTALSAGSTTISYTIATGCSNTAVFSVNPTPPSITGTASVCVAGTGTLANTLAGGTWISANTAVATIDATTALLTGVAAGTSIITYLMPTGCRRTAIATVNALPAAIGGTPVVCIGATTTLTDATTGGTWSSSVTSIATIGSSTGVVTGIAEGITTIAYTSSTGCTRTLAVTVNPLPLAITGTGSVCVNSTLTLSDATTGGNWISGSANATAAAGTGVVTGVTAGTALITYTLFTGCLVTTVVTVDPLPSVFSGISAVCAGANTTLGSTPTGGTWASGTSANATIAPASGIITGVSAGTSLITYTAPATGCMRTGIVTVNPLPSAISGTTSVCVGGVTTLGSAPAGGTWSGSSTATATVGASTGIVTGVAAGTVSVSYTLSTGCLTSTTVTANPLPSITGPATVCPGATVTLAGTITGGTWSSGTPPVATIGSSSGIVTGIATGTTIVTYTLPTGCTSMIVFTVNALTSAGTISGPSTVCVGASITVTDATAGGIWSEVNGKATVTGAGIVTGVAAGIDTVLYTVTGICGVATVAHVVTINPLPVAGAVSGTLLLCNGGTTTLSASVTGGTWSSSNGTIAPIGASSGTITAGAIGTATITYTVTNSCGSATATAVVTVLPTVDAGTVTGPDTVCQGTTITLLSSVSGGSWFSSAVAKATVTSAGVVTGIAPGTVTIAYALANACSADTATHTVVVRSLADCATGVNPVPVADESMIKIYPNPNNGSFTIDLPAVNNPLTITILDVTGKVIETRVINDGSVHRAIFNLTGIAPGSYTVKVNAGERVYREKLVIW